MNHANIAKDILKALNGKNNIRAATHCATRLRLVIYDESIIDQKSLDEHPDIKGTFSTNGQYQIIIGAGDVDKVYNHLKELTGLSEMTTDEIKNTSVENQKQYSIFQKLTNPFLNLIKVLSDIFVPIIPALIAGGLLMALNNVLTAEGLFTEKPIVDLYPWLKDIASFINTMAAAPFTFLPILIGYSATKRFGGNPFLGAAMAMIMVSPELISGDNIAEAITAGDVSYWNLFGLQVAQAGYQGTVLPVLVVSWILASIERFFHKRIPNAFDFTFTPMLAILITGFLTFIFVGPFLRDASDGLTNSIVWLYDTAGAFGTAIFGLFYSPIVITGLHQSFPAIETTLLANMAKTGGSFIFPVASMANIAQGAAALAVFFITNDKKQKGLSSSASISALLGITEPAIFGVNLKLKYPFFCAMIATSIASIFIGLYHVLAISMGPASVIGFIAIDPNSVFPFIISGIISFILAFIGTFLYGKKVKMKKPNSETSDVNRNSTISDNEENVAKGSLAGNAIFSPIAGKSIKLSSVNDDVFSSEMMGKGAAVIPQNGEIYAPCDGTILSIFDTKHAYGIKADNEAEVMIHIGLDTVNLKGEGFTSYVQKDQVIKQGDKIGYFDLQTIEDLHYDPTVIVVVTNSNEFENVEKTKYSNIKQGEKLLNLTVRK